MGMYYAQDGSFTSTLDIRPKGFFTKYTKKLNKKNKQEGYNKYNEYDEYDDDYYLNLDISYSDFMRVCNLLNTDKKDTTAAIIIQKWWKLIKYNQRKKYINAAIIIQRWWKHIKKDKNNKISIWDFLFFL